MGRCVLAVAIGYSVVLAVSAQAAQQPGVPYLFTTGYEPTEIPESYKLAPRLEKPIRVGAILDAIRQQLTSPDPDR